MMERRKRNVRFDDQVTVFYCNEPKEMSNYRKAYWEIFALDSWRFKMRINMFEEHFVKHVYGNRMNKFVKT